MISSSPVRAGYFIHLLMTAAFLVPCTRTPLKAANLLADPSFEETREPDQFGRVFTKWGGWKFDGDCQFAVGNVPHTGKTSALLYCPSGGKIRISQDVDLQPGKYRITAYLRGVDIGSSNESRLNTEFMFNGNYMQLAKGGTFGWTKMTYVAEIDKAGKLGPSFGLWCAGFFFIDDVTLEPAEAGAKTTPVPVLDKEEAPVGPPGPLGAGMVRCPRCGYRNMPEWHRCYACGEALPHEQSTISGPAQKTITSFEQGNPFSGGTVVAEHASEGAKSLRIDGDLALMDGPQDWSGYDYLKIDTFVASKVPLPLTVEIQDSATKDYWTRVNYHTTLPQGKSTLTLLLKHLTVGEKGRAARGLILGAIKRLVLAPGVASRPGLLFVDNIRLEREESSSKVMFDGLEAFSFGPVGAPLLDGFTAVTPGTFYSAGRGYGLKNARVWRAFNTEWPEPLYQDYMCIESGGFAIDVPNGMWRVVVNIDGAPGIWGENQIYRQRTIRAQGKVVVSEQQDFESFKKKYYAFWDKDLLPSESVFDKYDPVHFSPKTFDVEVTNGQLLIEFDGQAFANSVSALIVYPVDKAAEGTRFLEYVKTRRRFYFNNATKPVLHQPAGDALQPAADEVRQGAVFFRGDLMKDVYYNDTPLHSEIGKLLTGDAFPGQVTSLVAGVLPLRDLGHVRLEVSELKGPTETIPASAIELGYGSYNLSRVILEGTVYTITPRYIIPKTELELAKGVTRSVWLTIHTPSQAAPGNYVGQLIFRPDNGEPVSMDVRFTVRKGSLDPVDIPVGPFGGMIAWQWFPDDLSTRKFYEDLNDRSLALLRERGFTMYSGIPNISYEIVNGRPTIHTAVADQEMRRAGKLGFLAVSSYGAGVKGLDPYHIEMDKMKASGYSDYTAFIRAVYGKIQQHAEKAGWIPVFWNLGDEPAGDDLKQSIENARVYHAAFPKGPPFFTIPTSLDPGGGEADPHFELARNFTAPALSGFTESGVKLLRQRDAGWAFYNQANRWTYGIYMYKAAKEFGMKYRIGWHWNLVAGDPYYALDGREDDYAWANTSPDGKFVRSVEFERIAAGLNDYRELLTLARLAREKAGSPAAKEAEDLISKRMAAFTLDQRDHDAVFGAGDWADFRRKLSDAIEALQ